MLMMLYQHTFLLGGSRVHWIYVLQFYWPRIDFGPWKYRKKKNLAKNNTYILAEQVCSLTHTYLFVINFLLYFTPSDINKCENILCLNALIEATDWIAVVHQDFPAIDVKLVSRV